MAQMQCPKCRRMFDSERSDAMPFCSKRCRMADLYGWFTEGYSVPVDILGALEENAVDRPEEAEDVEEPDFESDSRSSSNPPKDRKNKRSRRGKDADF